jgi:hypothetical protein
MIKKCVMSAYFVSVLCAFSCGHHFCHHIKLIKEYFMITHSCFIYVALLHSMLANTNFYASELGVGQWGTLLL